MFCETISITKPLVSLTKKRQWQKTKKERNMQTKEKTIIGEIYKMKDKERDRKPANLL